MPALPIWLWILGGAATIAVVAKVVSGGGGDSIEDEAKSYKTPVVSSTEQFQYKPPSRAVFPVGNECEPPVFGSDPKCFEPFVGNYPFVFYTDGGTGIDVTGQWWMWINRKPTLVGESDPRYAGWFQAEPDDGSKDLGEYIDEYVPIVLEAAAVYVATFFGGPMGGLAARTAITAIKRIVNGTPVGQILVDAAKENFSGFIEKSEFGRAYKVFADNKYTRSSVLAVRNEVVSQFSPDTQEDVAVAFDDGLAIGRAKRVQDVAIAEVKQRLPSPDHRTWLQTSLDRGATLRDWCYAYGGNAATDLLSRIVSLAAEYVESGEVGTFLPYVGEVFSGVKPLVPGQGTLAPIRPTFVRRI